jgi:hypothetical protein
VYLRNVDGNWTQAPSQELVEQVSHDLFNEATATANPALIPDWRGALGRNVGQPPTNVPVILVRLAGFGLAYRWLTRENNSFVTKPITDPSDDDLLHAIQIHGANSPWPEFATRINSEMNSVRSGDVVLIINVETGFQTVGGVAGTAPEPGAHGGPTRAEAQVPLIFNMLGVNKQFLQDALGRASALPASKKDMRTHHLTPAVTEIMKELRGQ